MRQVQVRAGESTYPILIESGLLDGLGRHLPALSGRRAAVVADAHTGALYGERALQALRAGHIQGTLLTVPPGEASKSTERLLALYDAFLDMRLTRQDVVIALGGGVVGDLSGYAAASYLRGVPFVQAPTSLLAMVDSSVGGKVAVNLPRGKNLIGAFLQPRLVLVDTDTLKTLDRRQLGAGLGEVIKYGMILDAALFDTIERAGGWDALLPLLPELIARCCRLKADVVAEDPLDHGLRMILNYGHTLGHAIEGHSGYAVLHGEAVCIGMAAAARLGESLGRTEKGTAERLTRVLRAYGLPTGYPDAPPEELAGRMALDKKAEADTVRVVWVPRIGEAIVEPLPANELPLLAEAAR